MRSRFVAQVVVLTLITSFSLTGCSWWHRTFGPKKTTPSQPGSTQPTPLGDSGANGSAIGNNGSRPDLNGTMDRSQFAAQTIYFEYDSAKIKPSEHSKLEAVAAALKGNSKKLVIEGHTDERGTAEYNRALGEKRAQSARETLVSLGISGERMTTVSFGKDKPVEPSHNDTAWSRNRRCEFVVAGQ